MLDRGIQEYTPGTLLREAFKTKCENVEKVQIATLVFLISRLGWYRLFLIWKKNKQTGAELGQAKLKL